MEVTRHFAASVFIVHQEKVLLHFHRKLKTLLPVGGHLERDESPEDAALREAKEESGLEIVLWGTRTPSFNRVRGQINPVGVQLESIQEGHEHVDFIYFATTKSSQLQPELGEVQDLFWYDREMILKADLWPDVRAYCLRALDEVARG